MGTQELHDVSIRERQLEAHILRSSEYLKCADRDFKRQASTLYLALAVLLIFQGFFTFRATGLIQLSNTLLISALLLLAMATCFLLKQTKAGLSHLNEAWLAPQEKNALNALKLQRDAILTRAPRFRDGSENASLN